MWIFQNLDNKEEQDKKNVIDENLKMKDDFLKENENFQNINQLEPKVIIINKIEISNMITLKDFDIMDVNDLLLFDKRSFLKFYWDSILTRHDFLRAFIYKTALKPFYIRIILFFLQISVAFALNAIFYSDSYISEKNKVVLTTKMVYLFI